MKKLDPESPGSTGKLLSDIDGVDITMRKQDWQNALRQIQSRPLTYCPAFPAIAQRWNDWWRFQADRPLIIAQLPKDYTIRWDKAFDLLDQPEEWLQVRCRQVDATYFAGEALPFIRVDIGPVAMGAFLGAPLHFALMEQTSWQTPVIESWENVCLMGKVGNTALVNHNKDTWRLELDLNNEWLRKVMVLIERLAEEACGKYLVCLPDLTGAIDTLANLRSSSSLCFDLFEHREEILLAAGVVVDAWESVFTGMYDRVLAHGAGITQWVSCWADTSFTVPTCDFNALIGPEDFKEVCMPSLKEQAQRAGLCVFHLDGPQAARHAQTLAEDPDITAVQYSPGAATPSALAKLPMFKLLQQHQVSLFIEASAEETRQLAQELDPRGLAIRVSDLGSPEQADRLIEWRDETFR